MKKGIIIGLVFFLNITQAFSQCLCDYITGFTIDVSGGGCTRDIKFTTLDQNDFLARISIERSCDGFATWIEIARFTNATSSPVPIASGTLYPGSVTSHSYSYTDPNPYSTGCTNTTEVFYRLRFVDLDGSVLNISDVKLSHLSTSCSGLPAGSLCSGTLGIGGGNSTVSLCDPYPAIFTTYGTTPQSTSWSSSNTAIATINSNGVLTPLTIGTVAITATQSICDKTATRYISIVECTDSCLSTVVFNDGYIPTGILRYGHINVGSSWGTGGSLVYNLSNYTTTLTSSTEINFANEFEATVVDGEFNARIVSCSTGGDARISTGRVTTIGSYNLNEKKQIQQFSIFPNPVKDKLQIRFSSETTGLVEINLLDNKGVRVKHSSYNIVNKSAINNTELQVSDLPNGIYYIQIKDRQGTTTATTKVVKL